MFIEKITEDNMSAFVHKFMSTKKATQLNKNMMKVFQTISTFFITQKKKLLLRLIMISIVL